MDETEITKLVAQLSSTDPAARQRARESLVKLAGRDATQPVSIELTDPRPHVRWEAAKTLAAIADPMAAYSLLHALDDEDQDVRWLAAEGLGALGRVGLLTTLSGLTRQARSLDFCHSAHHALHNLRQEGNADVVNPVLKALESSEPEVTAPVAAYGALVALKQDRAQTKGS
jgi:HEAT repeat protein